MDMLEINRSLAIAAAVSLAMQCEIPEPGIKAMREAMENCALDYTHKFGEVPKTAVAGVKGMHIGASEGTMYNGIMTGGYPAITTEQLASFPDGEWVIWRQRIHDPVNNTCNDILMTNAGRPFYISKTGGYPAKQGSVSKNLTDTLLPLPDVLVNMYLKTDMLTSHRFSSIAKDVSFVAPSPCGGASCVVRCKITVEQILEDKIFRLQELARHLLRVLPLFDDYEDEDASSTEADLLHLKPDVLSKHGEPVYTTKERVVKSFRAQLAEKDAVIYAKDKIIEDQKKMIETLKFRRAVRTMSPGCKSV